MAKAKMTAAEKKAAKEKREQAKLEKEQGLQEALIAKEEPPVQKETSKITPVANIPEVQSEMPLEIFPGKKPEGSKGMGGTTGHKFWVIWNGQGLYKSASAIETALTRQKANKNMSGWSNISIKIPKGSPYMVPEELKGECEGCG